MSDLSGEEQVEGSWLPFIAVSAMVFIWWLTSSQSQSAVKLRRSYHMQVRYCAPPSQDNNTNRNGPTLQTLTCFPYVIFVYSECNSRKKLDLGTKASTTTFQQEMGRISDTNAKVDKIG